MKSVFLSAGHSDVDPGAVAFGRREADIATEFRNIESFYMHRAGVPHELDGIGTQNLPLREAVVKARRHPIGIEFHCNAGPPTATGVETLCAPGNMSLANRICHALSNALGIRNRGAKPENAGQHHRLAFVQAGGIIVELFFITNSHDLAAYDTRKWVAARDLAEVLIWEANNG